MTNETQTFIHLHVHSAYSLAEGAIKVKKLVGLCQDNHMPAVAITDTGNMFGAMEFAIEAAKGGIQPIIGCQIQLGLEGHQLVLLAQSDEGYKNLCTLVSKSFLTVETTTQPHVDWTDLEKHAAGIICLTGGIKGPVAQYLLHNQNKTAEESLKRLNKVFANRLYIELQRHGWPEEESVEEPLIELAYKHDIPLVATNDCYFGTRDMYEAHDALLCIAEGRYITESDRRRVTPEHYFKSAEEMIGLFADLPEAVQNTIAIARRCHFLLKPINPMLPSYKSESGLTEIEELKRQVHEGLERRLENFVYKDGKKDESAAKPYRDRLEFELETIIKMGFAGYFLIVSDFIKWAKEHDIPVGPGRGSGVGSVVAWSLLITDMDPLPFNLLFERMLNPERVSMPDFDVDFCQDRRDEVIRYVQQRYGSDHVAQIITFGQLKARAVVRDVGRVLQMPYGQVDRIAKMIPNNPANPITLEEALEQDSDLRAERDKDDTTKKLIDIALQLEGLNRHASTHAAGVVIGNRPLHELLPLYREPGSDMMVTQFNMKYIEQAGLVKFDFLGLKTMTVIKKAVDLINAKRDEKDKLDILKVPLDDQKTYRLLTEGKTVGVFQLEGSGMRDTLRRMKPDKFEHIIALVALYRPGPMDNIPRFIEIKDGRVEADYMHPKLQPYLEETYGIMVYQEQVMQAAQALSGYTLGGADLLRRAMGKKIPAEMEAQREIFISGAVQYSGVTADRASEIFDQIDKFAGYGFNKSHAAAYALIAYWTGWLKANYPHEFIAASMTLDMGNTDKLAVFKQDLERMDIRLLPPDLNKSDVEFVVENGSLRYAFSALKGVGAQAMEKLVQERRAHGPFSSLADFVGRMDYSTLNRRQLEQMARAGVFDSLNSNRPQIVEGAEMMLRHAQVLQEERASGQTSLFGGPAGQGTPMPELPKVSPWDQLEKLRQEFDAVGFYLSAHPLDTKAAQMERMNILTLAAVEEMMGNRTSAMIDMAGVLLKKQIKVSQKSGNKYAFLQLSDSTGIYEVVVFSETLSRAREWLNEGDTFLLKVTAEQQEDQIRFTVQDIQPLEKILAGKVRQVNILLDTAEAAHQLKGLVTAEGHGLIRVRIRVDLGDNRIAAIGLPGAYNFSPQTRNALTKIEGVKGVQEI